MARPRSAPAGSGFEPIVRAEAAAEASPPVPAPDPLESTPMPPEITSAPVPAAKPEPPAKPMERVRQERAEGLADFLLEFKGQTAPKMRIDRTFPKTYLGHVISGECHSGYIDFIDDADDLRAYVRKQFGGARFDVRVFTPHPKTGKPNYVDSFPLEIDAAPLRDGRVIEPIEAAVEAMHGRSVERRLADRYVDRLERQDDRPRDGGSGNMDTVIRVVSEAADQRAASAEASMKRESELLRGQLDAVREELRQARNGSGTRASDMKEIIESVSARSASSDAATNGAIAELRRDLDGARDQLGRERDAHRGEIATMRDGHRAELQAARDGAFKDIQALRDANFKEVQALREENRKELDTARREARENTAAEVSRVREDAKGQGDHLKAIYESREKSLQLEIDRLRHELTEARKAAISPEKAMEQAVGLYERMDERFGKGSKDDESTADKVIGAMSDPTVAAMIPGTLGMLGAILTGKPMVVQAPGAGPPPQQLPAGQPQQQLPAGQRGRAPFRRHVQAMPGAEQQQVPAGTAPAAVAQPQPSSPAPLPSDLLSFAPYLQQLEVAINADTHPDNYARGLVNSADNAILRTIAAQDPIAIVQRLDAAGMNTVLTSRRGKQYLVAVIESLRRFLAGGVPAPQPPAPPAPEPAVQQAQPTQTEPMLINTGDVPQA